MYRLLYISYASPLMNNQELENILQKSRANNKKDEVSGMLLYHEGVFIQLLEGPEDSVKKIFSKITLDARHENLFTLMASSGGGRLFKGCPMGYKELDTNDIKIISQLVPWEQIKKGRDLVTIEGHLFLDLFKQFHFKYGQEIAA